MGISNTHDTGMRAAMAFDVEALAKCRSGLMTRKQRRAHLTVWILLAPVLAGLLFSAMRLRSIALPIVEAPVERGNGR